MIDDRSLAVMGHSRGAKLAALHYAAGVESMNAQMGSNSTSTGAASIKLAVLVDPVDSKNPSAISALASCDNAQLVVIGESQLLCFHNMIVWNITPLGVGGEGVY